MPDYPPSLIAFQRRFEDDRACAEYLFSVRWPEGFRCPARGHPKGWAFQCAKCAKQTSVTSGTIMGEPRLGTVSTYMGTYSCAEK